MKAVPGSSTSQSRLRNLNQVVARTVITTGPTSEDETVVQSYDRQMVVGSFGEAQSRGILLRGKLFLDSQCVAQLLSVIRERHSVR